MKETDSCFEQICVYVSPIKRTWIWERIFLTFMVYALKKVINELESGSFGVVKMLRGYNLGWSDYEAWGCLSEMKRDFEIDGEGRSALA
uniref:Uncharacterized protein n=1 Tax=Salix viminalis TaxID=40686 RepID=A0A6N2LSI5_SALVM